MRKKGFTLIELLAVIVILGVLAAVVMPSVFNMTKKARDDAYNVLVNSFESNAELYVTRHKDEVESELDQSSYSILTLNDLIEEGLLKSSTLKDPRTNDDISPFKKVIVTRETDRSLSVCYEDRVCYVPTLLVNELKKTGNVVGGSVDGLHYDATNNYYYTGANPNNWLVFDNYLWRVVKINTDGTIKLIYEGPKDKAINFQTGTIGARTFNDNNTNVFSNTTSLSSYLESFYNTNILEKNKSKIQPTAWCNSKIAYDSNGTEKVTFLTNDCNSKTTALHVGLITGSEYLYASLDLSCLGAYRTMGDNGNSCKNRNYLNKTSYNYWSATSDNNSTNVWIIKNSGSLGAPVAANTTAEVRPVINLTNSVVIDRGNGTYDNPYVVKDIINIDKEKPVITINGPSTVEIGVGENYIDTGATATDNVDGDLTNQIIVVSNLNTNVVGNYTIKYVTSDRSGNEQTTTRQVKVIELYNASKGVNVPRLVQGMIPIKWDGSTWVDTDPNDVDWYNYTTTDKKWANARTKDGSMWVWIPRYAYQIATNYHTATAGAINVKFLRGKTNTASDNTTVELTPTYSGSSQTNYIKHPAFTFGTIEVTGIWVAKFEMSGRTVSLDSKPNAVSLQDVTLGDMFTSSRNMETNARYGWSLASTLKADGTFTTDFNYVDTHMMKNKEWGAVALLSQSTFGKNAEIWINPSSSCITGCSGTGASAGQSSGCSYQYNTSNGQQASTTGNIYGIYDMSGGTLEYVMANFNNTAGSSGITPSSINDKYIERYTAYDNTKYGDAMYETSSSTGGDLSWYGDSSTTASTGYHWFVRGGSYSIGSTAGAFGFSAFNGFGAHPLSWRVVVLVGPGL